MNTAFTEIDDFVRADFFDSRDMIELIEEFQNLADEHEDAEDGEPHTGDNYVEGCPTCDTEGAGKDFADLKAFEEEASGYVSDWRYGETFIADSYFEDYAQQFAEDIDAIKPNANWPLNHIDWEAAAKDLKQDYTEFELRGQTFFARS